jgi:hypothetical protein
MAVEWGRLCRTKDFSVTDSKIDVQFSNGRHHSVKVEELEEIYLLSAIVVRRKSVAALPDLPVYAWLRNRVTDLVDFRIDRRERLIGEAWVPKAGLKADEFQLYVRTVATECDQFEFFITGGDAK